jgi:hypothetical protein
MVRGSRPPVGDCDSEVVLEEEGWGCDDCDSRSSILGGEAGNLDGFSFRITVLVSLSKIPNINI